MRDAFDPPSPMFNKLTYFRCLSRSFRLYILGLFAILGCPAFILAQASVDETAAALNPIYVDVANISGTEDGSAAHPFNTIEEGIARLNDNKSTSYKLHIANGVYREGGLLLSERSGVAVIEGESRGGVIISGSDVWTGWTADGSNWYKTWPENWGLSTLSYPANPEGDLGRRLEMVFQDGVLLRQVLNLADMVEGTYFVDEDADRLYVRPLYGVDPSSPSVTMEVAVRTHLFFMYANDDTVFRNLTFQHAASGKDSGVGAKTVFIGGENDDSEGNLENSEYSGHPINSNPDRNFVENILIDNCIFRWNNGGGASINNTRYMTIKDTSFVYNGNSGLGATRLQYVEYVDSQFNYNNWRKGLLGDLYGWAPAGTKTLFADELLIRGCDFIGNQTTGLWMDFGSTNVTVFDSLMVHNWSQGFYNEANFGPMSASALLVRNNGYWPNDGGVNNGGVYFAESHNFSVSNSYIIDNAYYGLGYRNSSRTSTAYWSGSSYDEVDTWAGVSEKMSFFQNTVVASRGENHSSWDTEAKKNGNVIGLNSGGTNSWGTKSVPTYSGDYNTFYSPHTEEVFTDKQDDNYGWDEVDLAGWREDTNQDLNSTWDANWQDGLNFDAYQESGGLVVFEAENYHKNEKGTDDEIWQMNHGLRGGQLGQSGSGYLEPPVGGATGDSGSAKLTYRFYLETAGTYHLAVRRYAATTSNDSVHVFINGNPVGDSTNLLWGNVDRWTWKHANVDLGFLSAGLHTLEFVRRENGFAIDRIAIADDLSKLPAEGSTEIGPDETPLGRPAQSDTPVTVTAEKSIVKESEGQAVYRFTRPGIDGGLTVNFSVGGNATVGVDYESPGSSVLIPDGSSFAEVVVVLLDDAMAEEAKSLSLSVDSGPEYTVGVPSSAIVTQPANGLLAFTETNISQPTETTQSFTLKIHNPFAEEITYTLEDPGDVILDYIWVPETYSWNNIASGGNAIAALDDDDSSSTDSSMRVDFSNGYFEYYGVYDFDRCVVSSNGLISFIFGGGNYTRDFSGANVPLPTYDISTPTIAGYWADLKTVTSTNPSSRIYEASVGDRQIFQFEQLENSNGEQVTFQIVLDYNTAADDDNEVLLYFKDVPDGNTTHTIGAQGSARRVGGGFSLSGALHAYNESKVTDLSALRLIPRPNWFSDNQNDLSLTIPAGETHQIEFTIDTTGLPVGTELSRVFQLTPDRDDVENTPLTVNLAVGSGPGAVGFDVDSITVEEDNGTATLNVIRSAGSVGAISVDYATADGAALAGTNYTATSGTLNWADGETGTKSILVPLIDVPAIEPSKEFRVVLSNPLGGILLPAPTTATITIDDSAPNTAPSITVNRPAGIPTVEDLATELFLDVTVTDDNIPQPLAFTWEQISGPGTATFDDSSAEDTSVTFDVSGEYVLRLTADDSALTDVAEITVIASVPELVPPTDGLGLYYSMDANSGTSASDASPNGNFGKLLGESAGDGWASGYKNNGYLFADGSYTRITSNQRVNINESEGLTFAAWIRWDQGGSERFIATHGNAGTGTRREWLSVTSDGRLKSRLGGGTTQTSAGKITIGQWHHVAVTGCNGRIKLYIDGVKEADRGDSVETGGGNLQISNARLGFGEASVWRGMIDEVYCYNDTLNEYEIGILHGSSVYEENLAPEPTVGASQQVISGDSIALSGSASDDGLPDPPSSITYEWQQVSGPATALFVDVSDPNTNVTLPVKGDYRFRLVADDGDISSAAYVAHVASGDPSDLAVSEVDGTSAHLSWTDSVGETGYRVWMRVEGASEWTLVTDTLLADSVNYTVENLTRDLTYEFSVEAMDSDTPREGSEVSLVYGDGFTQGRSDPHLVVIEAEDYTYIGSNGAADSWSLTTAYAGYSGVGAMQAGPDNGDSYTFDPPNAAPYLAYDVAFETDGTHYLFVLCREPTGDNSGDSLHAGINGTMPTTGELIEKNLDDGGIGASFNWAAKLRNGTRVSLEVPSEGTHTIYIWPREDGLIVDKLLLTTDVDYVPTGSEPVSFGKPLGDYSAKEFWRMANWGISDDSGNAADLANPELDIFSNLEEFAFGGDPMSIDGPELLPSERIAEDTGKHYLEYSFRRRVGVASGSTESGYSVDGVTYKVEVSQDMSVGSWQTGSSVIDQLGAPVYNDDGTETVTVRVLENTDGAPKKFIRLKVE